MILPGSTVATRIMTAYIPCVTRKRAVTATIAQQRRYWRLQGNRNCPRKILCTDLIHKMKEWRNEGDTLIILLDSDEDMNGGPLARMLQHPFLDMRDAIKTRTHMEGPHTFIRGSRKIDGAWITPDIGLHASCFLSFFFGVGDYRGIILDIP